MKTIFFITATILLLNPLSDNSTALTAREQMKSRSLSKKVKKGGKVLTHNGKPVLTKNGHTVKLLKSKKS